MPFKKGTRISGSSKQSSHPSNLSRSPKKRSRAIDQTSSIPSPSSASATENQDGTKGMLALDGSRLKKKRLGEPLDPPPQGMQGEDDVRAKAAELSTAIHSVANHCEQLIQLMLKNRCIMRPPLELLQHISLVLQKTSSVNVLASVSNLPKILFIAAQLGVKEELGTRMATKALVEALTHLAKIQTDDLPDFSSKKRRVRSAFVDDAYVDFTEMQIETAKKAGQWSLELLSNCVRGVSDSVAGRKGDDHRNQYQHTNVSELFVLPRDKLDPILAAHLVENSTCALRNKFPVEESPRQNLVRSKLSDSQLNLVLCHPLCSSLLDQLLLNAEKTYTSCVRCSLAKEPLDFLSTVGERIIQEGQQTFLTLSPPSQTILLRRSEKVRSWYRQRIELVLLATDRLCSLKETRNLCAPFANLIAFDVATHWDLMDEVRREVSRNSEPFNLLSWRLRPFYQTVFLEAMRVIRSETVPVDYGELFPSGPTPLSKRFPSSLRSITRFLETSDKCFDQIGKNSEDALKTAVQSLKCLARFLRGTYGAYQISASLQTFLLCVESVLERLSWICAIWVTQETSHGTKSETGWPQVIQDISVVICSMEVFRLPGGKSAETHSTMCERIRKVESLLSHAIINKNVILPPNRKRTKINNLLAFWLAGFVYVRGLNGFPEAVKSMDRFEVLQILRSLEAVSSWSSSDISRKRYEDGIQIVKRVIQNVFQ